MAEELLEKIPPERRWAITANTLWRFLVLRGEKLITPELGKGKDIFSPLWIKEKWNEINEKVIGDAGRHMMPMVKETFNISVENAVEAAKLVIIVSALIVGPEQEYWETFEETTEGAVIRAPKCWCWQMYDDYEIEPEFRPCEVVDQAFWPEGFQAINPKITFKVTKMLPWGDPYCECVIEFKDE